MAQTSSPTSPLARAETWNLVADAYAAEVVPSFEPFAVEALRLGGVKKGMEIVDVAAGPGTLSLLAAELGARVAALDLSPEMIANLRRRVGSSVAIEAMIGDGQALPYADERFDGGFSMFGLMFFPDRAAGFRELRRVLRPGARAVVSSWVELSTVPELAVVFGTLAELGPKREGAEPPVRMPLADAATCVEEMSAAGFRDVRVEMHTSTAEHESTAAMIDSFARSSAPIVLLRRTLGDAWPALAERWRDEVIARLGAGPIQIRMPAHLIVGSR